MESKKISLVVISAPSGCGKDTVAQRVCARMPSVGTSISCTTRAKRMLKSGEMEQDGKDYYFLTQEAFEEKLSSGGFLEYARYAGELYGTPRSEMERLSAEGKDIFLLIVEEKGAAQVKAADPTATTIFLLPPSAQELRRRLEGRGSDSAEKVEKRMAQNVVQMKMAYFYDYVVMNDDLDAAVEQVVHILEAVRCRTSVCRGLIDRVNETF